LSMLIPPPKDNKPGFNWYPVLRAKLPAVIFPPVFMNISSQI